MKETLLEKAKNLKVGRRLKEEISDEHIDLAIAWAERVITLSQACIVLKLNSGRVLAKMSTFLRAGFEKGKIKKT